MEQHVEVTAKKIWSIARVLFFMLRKGIWKKSKMLLDLNMMIKRGKIAGKALHNLIFHHQHHHHMMSFVTRPGEYEFSCTNSPAYPITSLLPTSFTLHKNRKQNVNHVNINGDEEEMAAVVKVLEMMQSGAASPTLPGFGKTPVVRQLRITDSPFPLCDLEMGDSHVDEAAEEFIINFYKQLKKQNL